MTDEIKYDEAKLKEIQGRLDAVTNLGGGFHWGDHAITAGGNTYIADCGDNIMSDRIAELVVAARPALDYLLSLCRAQHAEIDALEALADSLGHPVDSPCGHSGIYAVSDDGGANIRCLVCRESRLESEIARLKEMVYVPKVLSGDEDLTYQDYATNATGRIISLKEEIANLVEYKVLADEAAMKDHTEIAKLKADLKDECQKALGLMDEVDDLIETLSTRAAREVEMIAEVEAHFRGENAEVWKLLIGVAGRRFESGYCWCEIPCPIEESSHVPECQSARAALRNKEKSNG